MRLGTAGKKYRTFVEEGVSLGRRPELVGGADQKPERLG
jgi:hypothetical protein